MVSVGSEKQFYKPLHAQGFKRTKRGRAQNYTHVYERHIPKTDAFVIVHLTADQLHIVTYKIGEEPGAWHRFDTLPEMNSLIQQYTNEIQTKYVKSEEKRGKTVRTVG